MTSSAFLRPNQSGSKLGDKQEKQIWGTVCLWKKNVLLVSEIRDELKIFHNLKITVQYYQYVPCEVLPFSSARAYDHSLPSFLPNQPALFSYQPVRVKANMLLTMHMKSTTAV